MRELVQDSRYSLRLLGKSPGFAAVAILTLALAVFLLAAIGLASSFLPARRASHLDLMTALRYE